MKYGPLREGIRRNLTVVGLDGLHQQPLQIRSTHFIFLFVRVDVRMTMVAGKEILP
jgi:cytosine/adenosine deaminase-related metal-dependent hydrolase